MNQVSAAKAIPQYHAGLKQPTKYKESRICPCVNDSVYARLENIRTFVFFNQYLRFQKFAEYNISVDCPFPQRTNTEKNIGNGFSLAKHPNIPNFSCFAMFPNWKSL